MGERWVPTHDVFGSSIPVGAARIIKIALEEMVRRGDVEASAPAFQGVEWWAAEYLGGIGYERWLEQHGYSKSNKTGKEHQDGG